MNDPIVAETRQAREEYLKECGHNLQALYESLKQQEENSTRTYLALPPKAVQRQRTA